MIEEIKEDNNCIVKAFENNPIAILHEDINNKKVYYFKASDIGKALGIVNIHSTIQNYEDEDERVIRKAYDPQMNLQNTTFLSSQGVYRLLYSSKKEIAKRFRKWAGNILDDIIFNQSKELKRQIEEKDQLLENNKKELQQTQQQLKKEKIHKNQILRRKYYDMKQGDAIYLYKDDENNERSLLKIGKSKNISEREKDYSNMSKNGSIIYVKRCLNCDLTESLLHHLLDKYRINSMQEWLELPSEEFGKQIIDTIINLIDLQIENIYTFIPTLQNFINTNNTNINNNIDNNIEDTNTNEQLDTERNYDIKRVNPKDFDRFIKECCELSFECKTPKADIKRAHRIWSKCSIKDVVSSLDNYLKVNFKSGVDIQDDIKKNIYKGIRLKPLNYTPENDLFLDYETFIIEKCEVNWNYKISYVDFFNNFVSWKKLIDPDYNLQFKYKKDIQKYLERHFAGGRVFLSNDSSNTHLFGVWGLGISSNNFGSKIPKRTTKKVSEYNASTNQLIRSWESLSVASRQLNIPVSTLSNYCRFNTIVSDSIFKYELS